MKWAYFTISILVLNGCIRTTEEITNYTATVVNNTSHIVIFKPYAFGSVRQDKQFTLAPGSSLEIANGFMRGITVLGSGFGSDYLAGSDSIEIVFDNIYKMTHYGSALPTPLSGKHYLYTSNRNILNKNSYFAKQEGENKYSVTYSYTYTFTEQDYLDAK